MPNPPRVAIVCPAGRDGPDGSAARAGARFADLLAAFAAAGVEARPVLYRDELAAGVRQELLGSSAALVWVNPIEGGRDRSVLDGLLRDVAAAGVFVSAHPDAILKMGTKEVLWATREVGWSAAGDMHVYRTPDALRGGLAERLRDGAPRVLKQYRGNGGDGVWRVDAASSTSSADPEVQVLHALRGSRVERMPLSAFVERCAPYFARGGRVIDQPFVSPEPRGMIRAYMTLDAVVGFGHQHVTAITRPDGAAADGHEPPAPQPRLYYPPSQPEFQPLRRRMETEWIAQMRRALELEVGDLPVLWDADFLCPGDDYVLCEINVSSVHPYPPSAVAPMVEATVRRLRN